MSRITHDLLVNNDNPVNDDAIMNALNPAMTPYTYRDQDVNSRDKGVSCNKRQSALKGQEDTSKGTISVSLQALL